MSNLRTISLPDDLDEKLKGEKVSELIQNLLRDYFKRQDRMKNSPKNVLEQLEAEKHRLIELVEKKVEKIEKEKEEAENTWEKSNYDTLKEYERLEEKLTARRKTLAELAGREPTDEEFKEFNELFEAGKINAFQFAEKMNGQQSLGQEELMPQDGGDLSADTYDKEKSK